VAGVEGKGVKKGGVGCGGGGLKEKGGGGGEDTVRREVG